MTEWSAMVDKVMNLKKQRRLRLLGNMWSSRCLHLSVVEALKHSGLANDAEIA